MEQNIFSYLLSTPGNDTCFECGAGPILYVSVNNGIFLCKQCGELHEQLPQTVSYVKSIQADGWTDLEVDLLVNGGNKRLGDLFIYYNVPREANFDFKYKTKIGFYYRFMLMAIVKGEDPGAPPEVSEALLIGTEQTQKRDGKAPEDFWKRLDYYGSKGVDYTKKTFGDVKKTVSDPEWQKKVKEQAIQTGVNVGNTMANVAVETKTFFVNAKKETEEKGFLTFAKGLGEKGITNTKKGLSSAFGFVTKHLSDEPRQQQQPPVVQYSNPFQDQANAGQQGMNLAQQNPSKEPAKNSSSQEQTFQ